MVRKRVGVVNKRIYIEVGVSSKKHSQNSNNRDFRNTKESTYRRVTVVGSTVYFSC